MDTVTVACDCVSQKIRRKTKRKEETTIVIAQLGPTAVEVVSVYPPPGRAAAAGHPPGAPASVPGEGRT